MWRKRTFNQPFIFIITDEGILLVDQRVVGNGSICAEQNFCLEQLGQNFEHVIIFGFDFGQIGQFEHWVGILFIEEQHYGHLMRSRLKIRVLRRLVSDYRGS